MTVIHGVRRAAGGDVSPREVRNETLHWSARLGLSARALIYILIGFLAVLVAIGHSAKETDQWGAFQQLNQGTFGHVVLWALAIGLAGYSLWRFSEAALGAAGEGRKVGPRVKSFFRGCIYGFFAVSAFQVALGDRTTSQAQRQQSLTAKVMQHQGGRWAVGLAGVVVLVVGLMLVYEGLSRKFEKNLRTSAMSRPTRRIVTALGTFGTTARGAVFALAGAFVVQAAVDYQPSKAAGLDGALRSLRDTRAGPWLLGVAAVGLIAFGIYGLAEARWRRVS
jgi:type IV secretory pathway VirB2 component (pilin)